MNRARGSAGRGALQIALAMLALLFCTTAQVTPQRPETGLPYAPEVTPPQPTMEVGSLHGQLGPIELGLLADLFVTQIGRAHV